MISASISPSTEISIFFCIYHRYFGDIQILYRFFSNVADLISVMSALTIS